MRRSSWQGSRRGCASPSTSKSCTCRCTRWWTCARWANPSLPMPPMPEKQLRQAEAARDIPLVEAFREAQQRKRRGVVILGDPGLGQDHAPEAPAALVPAQRHERAGPRAGYPAGLPAVAGFAGSLAGPERLHRAGARQPAPGNGQGFRRAPAPAWPAPPVVRRTRRGRRHGAARPGGALDRRRGAGVADLHSGGDLPLCGLRERGACDLAVWTAERGAPVPVRDGLGALCGKEMGALALVGQASLPARAEGAPLRPTLAAPPRRRDACATKS